jgi:hypothetical protein
MGEVRDILLRSDLEGKSIVLLEGSQVSPSRPSDKSREKLKKLEWFP